MLLDMFYVDKKIKEIEAKGALERKVYDGHIADLEEQIGALSRALNAKDVEMVRQQRTYESEHAIVHAASRRWERMYTVENAEKIALENKIANLNQYDLAMPIHKSLEDEIPYVGIGKNDSDKRKAAFEHLTQDGCMQPGEVVDVVGINQVVKRRGRPPKQAKLIEDVE